MAVQLLVKCQAEHSLRSRGSVQASLVPYPACHLCNLLHGPLILDLGSLSLCCQPVHHCPLALLQGHVTLRSSPCLNLVLADMRRWGVTAPPSEMSVQVCFRCSSSHMISYCGNMSTACTAAYNMPFYKLSECQLTTAPGTCHIFTRRRLRARQHKRVPVDYGAWEMPCVLPKANE